MQEQEFKNHQLWNILQQMEDKVYEASTTPGSEKGASEPLAQLRYVVAQLREHSNPGDTSPYAETTLTNLQQNLNNALGELNNYASNQNVGHLTKSVEHADKAKHFLGLLPPVTKSTTAASVSKTFNEFRELAEQTIEGLQSRNEELQEKLRAREQEHADKEEQANARLHELSRSVETFQQQITNSEQRLDAAVTDTAERFNEKQREREERFASWLTEQGDALKNLASPHLDELDRLQDEGRERYEEINGLRDETQAVAAAASGDQLAGHYFRYSQSQWRFGLTLSGVGIIGLIIGALVIIWTLSDIGPSEEVSWQFTALKTALTATVVGAAVVAIRIGAQFLSRAHNAKEVELELRAIGPFLADVDPMKAQESKTSFIERRFGQPNNGSGPAEANSVNVTAFDQLLSSLQRFTSGSQ